MSWIGPCAFLNGSEPPPTTTLCGALGKVFRRIPSLRSVGNLYKSPEGAPSILLWLDPLSPHIPVLTLRAVFLGTAACEQQEAMLQALIEAKLSDQQKQQAQLLKLSVERETSGSLGELCVPPETVPACVRLALVTPCQLSRKQEDLPPPPFVTAKDLCLRTANQLARQFDAQHGRHTEHNPKVLEQVLVDAFATITTVDRSLTLVEQGLRVSGEQHDHRGRPTGDKYPLFGYEGTLTLQGELTQAWPWLLALVLAGVGQHRTDGQGRVELLTPE